MAGQTDDTTFCLLCSEKVRGALMGAPFFIGLTLLMQRDDVTMFLYNNLVTFVALVATIGLLVWWSCYYPPFNLRQRGSSQHVHHFRTTEHRAQRLMVGQHSVSAHFRFVVRR